MTPVLKFAARSALSLSTHPTSFKLILPVRLRIFLSFFCSITNEFVETGQKHRVRAVRRGLKTDQANVSPSSSTLTSSASESEKGFPTNSSLNLVREGSSSSSARRSSAANLLASSLGVAAGGSTRNRSLTFGGVRSVLSRHLSSSCLTNKQMHYRSTSSLRKAISSTTLSKSRSMNLLICDPLSANRRLHAQQSSGAWSYESEDESTSISDNNDEDDEDDRESLLDEHVLHVHTHDEEEDDDENLARSESSGKKEREIAWNSSDISLFFAILQITTTVWPRVRMRADRACIRIPTD